jgi:membrane associated rhomboid family serine protease
MTFELLVVLLCSALWLLHAVQLVRSSLRRTWPALVYALAALSATVASYFFYQSLSAAIAGSIIALFLVAPTAATQAASRALKWGRIGRARALALSAFILRPLAGQRIFRRAVDVAWRVDRGETVDIEAEVDALGPLSPVERAAHGAAFRSWTNDFAGIARGLEEPAARRFALRSGMAAIVVSATGETSGPDALVALHRELCESGALAPRRQDSAWALLALAAHLGQAELVREHAPDHTEDAPPERMAFIIATAEQRAGDSARARRTIEAALASPGLRPSARARLHHRLEHPLAETSGNVALDAARADVSQRLEALRTLAPLRMGAGRPAPVTLLLSASIVATYLGQVARGPFEEVFRRYGVIAPFAVAPDPYRLLSYAWLHRDVGHLCLNLVGLLVFGRFVERHFGRARLLAIYLAGALAGAAAFLAWERDITAAVGASGAVLALFGATVARIALDRVRRSAQGRRELLFLVSLAVLQLVVDAFWPRTSGAAHAGGLAAGLLLGALFRRR